MQSASNGAPELLIENRFFVESSAQNVIIHVVGEVDLANVAEFESALIAGLATEKPVVVDLTECRYLDSTFIDLVIKKVGQGANMRLIAKAATPVQKVFRVVGLDRILSIVYVP